MEKLLRCVEVGAFMEAIDFWSFNTKNDSRRLGDVVQVVWYLDIYQTADGDGFQGAAEVALNYPVFPCGTFGLSYDFVALENFIIDTAKNHLGYGASYPEVSEYLEMIENDLETALYKMKVTSHD